MAKHVIGKNQARMLWIREMQKVILDSLYAEASRALYKEMYKIAQKNQMLLKARTPTFFFDGKWWPTTPDVKREDWPKVNKVLHESLYKEVYTLLKDQPFRDKTLRIGVETMVGNYLAAARHTDDLKRLFPTSILHLVPSPDPEVFNIGNPMTEEEVEGLLAKNESNSNYLKRLVLTQTLLARL